MRQAIARHDENGVEESVDPLGASTSRRSFAASARLRVSASGAYAFDPAADADLILPSERSMRARNV